MNTIKMTDGHGLRFGLVSFLRRCLEKLCSIGTERPKMNNSDLVGSDRSSLVSGSFTLR